MPSRPPKTMAVESLVVWLLNSIRSAVGTMTPIYGVRERPVPVTGAPPCATTGVDANATARAIPALRTGRRMTNSSEKGGDRTKLSAFIARQDLRSPMPEWREYPLAGTGAPGQVALRVLPGVLSPQLRNYRDLLRSEERRVGKEWRYGRTEVS